MITIILKIIIVILNIIYFFIKLLPMRKKVVMISRQSNNINMDFKLLGNELEKKYKVVYLCKTLDGGVKSSIMTKISYGFHMFRQMYHLATSKVCILDSYCPTVSILKHKKSLVIIQIWHSIGTMKLFGYTALDKNEGSSSKIANTMKMHKNYTYVYASSEAYKDHLRDGFGVDRDIIKTFTLPRIDLLSDEKYEKETKKKIYDKYPELKKKINILYTPTFRKEEDDFEKHLNNLIKYIDFNKYNFIVKLHPLSKIHITNKDVICDTEFTSFDMLFVADKLISDYSCFIYEAGVRNIPLYFYDYDIEKYENDRGLAISLKELPGFIESDPKKLVYDLDKDYDYKYLKKFINKYVSNTKDCTKKIVNEIDKIMK